jgi:hypothetical protein
MAKIKLNVLGANLSLLHLPVGSILFSYETPVAAYVSGKGYVRTAERFSKTTSKHINQWLDGRTAEVVPQSEIEALTEVLV